MCSGLRPQPQALNLLSNCMSEGLTPGVSGNHGPCFHGLCAYIENIDTYIYIYIYIYMHIAVYLYTCSLRE